MRTPTGTLLRAVLTALLAVPLVAACSDDPKAGTIKTPEPSNSSSASSTPSTPEAQVEATMQAYFAAANEMFKTGDVTEIRSFSTSGCPCRKITRYVERVSDGGGEFRGAGYANITLRVHDLEGDTALAEATATVAPYTVVDGDGEVLENSGGGKLHTDYSLVRSEEGTWIIGNAFDLG